MKNKKEGQRESSEKQKMRLKGREFTDTEIEREEIRDEIKEPSRGGETPPQEVEADPRQYEPAELNAMGYTDEGLADRGEEREQVHPKSKRGRRVA